LAAARDLVVALVSAGASDEALQLAEGEASIILEHMEGARSDAERHLELSQLRAVMGSDTRAREHVERAKRLGVNEPGSILAMAQAHALLGDYESALTEVALALDEGYSDPFLALFAPPAEAIEIEADRDYATGKLAGEDAEEETGGSADEWWKKK
jgi:hypothetical protein